MSGIARPTSLTGRQFLLDTQMALWLLTGDERIDESKFRTHFLAEGDELIFHQVSTWEIQIKFELGKLPLPERPENFLPAAIEEAGFSYEQIEDKGIFFLDRLPPIHRDPFDRLLIAHAIANGWTILSADELFVRYPVSLARLP